VRAAELRLPVRDGSKPGPNQVPARLLRTSDRPHGVRLEFSGGIQVDASREEFERQRDNKEWLVEFPPQSLRVV
jgi:hypothetical protein